MERVSRRSGNRAAALSIAALLALVAMGAGMVLGLAGLAVMAALDVERTPVRVVAVATLATQGIAFVGTSWIYFRIRNRRLAEGELRIPTRDQLRWGVRVWALSIAWVFIAGMIAQLLGLEPAPHRLEGLGREAPEIFPLLAVLSFVVIGPGEELLFRGTIQRHLAGAFSERGALVIAAVLFAVVHVVALEGVMGARALSIAVLFVPSLLFGVAYARTRSVAVAALAHGAYNATLLMLLYSAV